MPRWSSTKSSPAQGADPDPGAASPASPTAPMPETTGDVLPPGKIETTPDPTAPDEKKKVTLSPVGWGVVGVAGYAIGRALKWWK